MHRPETNIFTSTTEIWTEDEHRNRIAGTIKSFSISQIFELNENVRSLNLPKIHFVVSAVLWTIANKLLLRNKNTPHKSLQPYFVVQHTSNINHNHKICTILPCVFLPQFVDRRLFIYFLLHPNYVNNAFR